jgi:3-dehydroshikimate dehydratase
MLKTGLVSVTFRRLSPQKIIDAAKKANLQAIEWGGDVHVPPNEFKNAEKVFELTRKAGLEVAAYGSYFRLGSDLNFDNVLQTAEILQTKFIRVWAGEKGSNAASENYRRRIIEESQRICEQAAKKDISIVYEFHGETLTDSGESCRDLLKKTNRPNLKTYWQPNPGKSLTANLHDLETILPFVAGVHVFHWFPDDRSRLSLTEGLSDWMKYFDKLQNINGFALLEFIKDDDLHNFEADAKTLFRLLESKVGII